jgi:hypothetical protein
MKKEYRNTIRTGPRWREKKLSTFDKTFYDDLVKKHPDVSKLKYGQVSKLIKDFHFFLHDEIVDSREGVELPQNLGFCFIGACNNPKKVYNYDHKVSLQYNQAIRHKNIESDDYLAKIFYTNYTYKHEFTNRELWKFKAVRAFTSKVSKAFRTNWMNYIRVEPYQLISTQFKTATRTARYKRKLVKASKDYNEFEID